MRKEIITSAILFLMVLNVAVFAQTAVQPNGSGTVEDPYLIATLENLNWISQNRASWIKHFVQTADIDASGSNDGANGFLPIGDDNFPFYGTYKGQGHTINALYINRPAEDTIGLFGFIASATVTNLGLTNVEITGKSAIGSIAGYDLGSYIDDCYSTGSVTGYATVGGLVGYCAGLTAYINNSYSKCTVLGDLASIGGFIGAENCNIDNCYSTGTVSTINGDAGGFVGLSQGTLTNCFSIGNVIGTSSSSNRLGGFVGAIIGGEMEACFSLGDVINGYSMVGGFVGLTNGGSIKRCYSNGNVEGYYFTGGFVGFHKNFDINNSYSTGNVTRSGATNEAVGGFCGKIVETSNISFCYSTGSVYYVGASTQPTNKGFVAFEEVDGTYTYVSNYFDGNSSGQLTATGATSASTTDMQQEIRLYTDFFFPNTGLSTAWDFDGTQYNDAATNDYWKMKQGGYPIIVSTFGASTNTVTNITYQSATSGGHIFYSGSEQILERGICWSTSSNPTILDSKIVGDASTYFSASLTGLSEGTTYYVRAYVTNNAGTTYGDEETFTTTNLTPSGSGTSSDPYLIESLDNLYWVTQNSNSWDKYFKQIADIDATNSSSWDGGAGFIPIGNATVGEHFTGNYNGNNYTISNITINRPTESHIGMFGYNQGTISNLGVENVDITGKLYTGGLVGTNYNGTITECYSTGAVSGSENSGGLVGYNYGTISKSYSRVNVTSASNNIGGLVGYSYGGTISKCYATGNISGGDNISSFVGLNSSSISECFASGSATSSGTDVGGFVGENTTNGAIDHCYAVGVPTGTNNGGFAGNNGSTITDSFWDTETSGTNTGVGTGTSTGANGKTTANMKTSSTFTDAGWDFTNIWNLDPAKNEGYPNLENTTSPTPVELTSFSAKLIGENVVLNWHTATEVNNYGFQVERQKEKGESEWENIGFVEGHGNSNSPKDYSFVDADKLIGTIKYRLKQIDIDGAFEYSDIVEVNINSDLPAKFELTQNYPNPFNPTTTINYTVPVVETRHALSLQLNVYDALGRKVATLVNETKTPGNYSVQFDASKLSSGIYYYTLQAGDFTATKKMILMK